MSFRARVPVSANRGGRRQLYDAGADVDPRMFDPEDLSRLLREGVVEELPDEPAAAPADTPPESPPEPRPAARKTARKRPPRGRRS